MSDVDEDKTSVEMMLEAAEAAFRYDGMFHHFDVDGESVGAICLDNYHEEDQLCLSLVKISRSKIGQGLGSRLLDITCKMADEHGVELYIEMVPTGRLDLDDLTAWYGRRGFESVTAGYNAEGPAMARSPQPVQNPTPEM